MINTEYKEIIRRLNLTQAEFAEAAGINLHTVHARCSATRTRITAKAEIEMLRFALARVLRMTITGPAPRIKHEREIPPEFEVANRRAAAQRAGSVKRAAPAKAPAAPQTCLWRDPRTGARCTLKREAMPGARLCVAHGQEAGFAGIRRFDPV